MKIGEKIKIRRKELRMSQRDLAEKMGYNHSTITRIENGKIDIPQSRIVQFADVLNTGIAYLMDWEEEIAPDDLVLTEDERLLISLFRQVPADMQRNVLDSLKLFAKHQK